MSVTTMTEQSRWNDITQVEDRMEADDAVTQPIAADPSEGFEIWYAERHAHILAALTVALGDPDRASEATSEAFARAYARWDRVSTMRSPTGWVFKVGLNYAKRQIGRSLRERTAARRIALSRTSAEPGTDLLDLWDSVRSLPKRQRTAIVFRYIEDLTQHEIALRMGVAEGTVAATLSQARQRIADSIAEEET